MPDNWPVDPVILEILKDRLGDPAAFEWSDYIYIHKRDNRVIGDGGFKGPPDSERSVEIGYAIIPEYRGMGLAAEGARALLEIAFSDACVKLVRADTTASGLASMAVLRKTGMTQYGTWHNDEDGNVLCWRILRDEWERQSPLR